LHTSHHRPCVFRPALEKYEDDDDPDNPLVKGPDGVPMPRGNAKSEMAFVTLRKDLIKDKKETEEQGVKWEHLMKTAGLEAKPYVIEDHKILYVCNRGPMEMIKVRVVARVCLCARVCVCRGPS
jgi:hypothetical protein